MSLPIFIIGYGILLLVGAPPGAAGWSLRALAGFNGNASVRDDRKLTLRRFRGAVIGFQLIDTKSNKVLFNMTNNQVIAFDEIPGMITPSFNIRALTSGSGIKAVQFDHNGNIRVEVKAPWALCGSNVGTSTYPTCPNLGLGAHSVAATPFKSRRVRSSNKGKAQTIAFTIVQSKGDAPKTPMNPTPTIAVADPTVPAPIAPVATTKVPASAPLALPVAGPAMAPGPFTDPKMTPLAAPASAPIKAPAPAPMANLAPLPDPVMTPFVAPTSKTLVSARPATKTPVTKRP